MMERINALKWQTKIFIILLAYILSISFFSMFVFAQSVPIRGECINDSYVHIWIYMNVSGEDMLIDINDTYCPSGCVVGQGQYGDDCAITDRYCVAHSLTTGWNTAFFYGIGGILMLVGASLIVDNVVRYNDRKEKSFVNP